MRQAGNIDTIYRLSILTLTVPVGTHTLLRPSCGYSLPIPSGIFEPYCCSLYHRKINILKLHLVAVLAVASTR